MIVYFKSERCSELLKELKSLGNKDANKKRLILLDLQSLNFDPNQESVLPLETIQAQALEFHRELKDREHNLAVENDLEASMLCQVSRLNFLNFLKVFQVEVEFGDERVGEVLSPMREEISKLNEQILVFKSNLIIKVTPSSLFSLSPSS